MRLASAMVGGLGALVGMAKGVFWFVGWLVVGLSAAFVGLPEGAPGSNPYLNLMLGTEGATAVLASWGWWAWES